MGREGDLPTIFRRLHKRHGTPIVSLTFTGLVLLALLFFNIEVVAASADVLFLLLFLAVCVAYLKLRKTRTELDYGFRAPLFPLIPLVAIVLILVRIGALWFYPGAGPVALTVAALGILAGLGVYFVFRKAGIGARPVEPQEEMIAVPHALRAGRRRLPEAGVGPLLTSASLEAPGARRAPRSSIEGTQGSQPGGVLVGVGDPAKVGPAGSVAAFLAQQEITAVHFTRVITVPFQTALSAGHPTADAIAPRLAECGAAFSGLVPTESHVVLARSVPHAIIDEAASNERRYIVMGWDSRKDFDAVVRQVVDRAPNHVLVVKHIPAKAITRVMVCVKPNRHDALGMLVARHMAAALSVPLRIIHVKKFEQEDDAATLAARRVFERHREAGLFVDVPVRFDEVRASSPAMGVLEEVMTGDLLVLGAAEEPWYRHYLFGTVAENIAQKARCTTVMVRRRLGPRPRGLGRLLWKGRSAMRYLEPDEPSPDDSKATRARDRKREPPRAAA